MKFVIMFLTIILGIGLIKIRFKILYCDAIGFSVKIRILFLKFTIFSSKKKKEIKSKNEIAKKDKHKKKKSVFKTINFVKVLVIPLPKLLKFLINGLKITKLKLNISISKEYAEKTALEYAKISCLVYNLFCLIKRYIKTKNEEILIKPNFLEESSKYNCLLNFNIRFSRIFIGICIYFFNVLLVMFSENSFKKS